MEDKIHSNSFDTQLPAGMNRRNFMTKAALAAAGLFVAPSAFATPFNEDKKNNTAENIFDNKTNQRTVLLINAHLTYPGWSEGTLNKSFFDVAKKFFLAHSYRVLETKIEDEYIVEEEVEKHLQADLVILQTPVNWISTPWIYKKYIDEVFNSALRSQKFLSGDGRSVTDPSKQYGTGGKMQGKKFMICAT